MSSFLLFSKHWTRASFLCAWHLARYRECCGEWNIHGLSSGPTRWLPCVLLSGCRFLFGSPRDLMSIHCHLMREPLYLRDTHAFHRKPLKSHSLVRTRIPSYEGLTVLFSGTRALAYIGSDTLLLRFFYIRTALNNFFILKTLILLV